MPTSDPEWLKRALADGSAVEKRAKMPVFDSDDRSPHYIPSLEELEQRNKYGNRKVEIRGHKFDSTKEAMRYLELLGLMQTGGIRNLELQPKFVIMVNGQKVCTYKADFRYRELDGGRWKTIVEDVKSEITRKHPVYRLKCKLMKAVHGIVIRET